MTTCGYIRFALLVASVVESSWGEAAGDPQRVNSSRNEASNTQAIESSKAGPADDWNMTYTSSAIHKFSVSNHEQRDPQTQYEAQAPISHEHEEELEAVQPADEDTVYNFSEFIAESVKRYVVVVSSALACAVVICVCISWVFHSGRVKQQRVVADAAAVCDQACVADKTDPSIDLESGIGGGILRTVLEETSHDGSPAFDDHDLGDNAAEGNAAKDAKDPTPMTLCV